MIEPLIFAMNHTRNATLKLVADLNDQQMVAQPAPGTNHPAWVLGHLLQVDYRLLNLLGGPAPEVDEQWRQTYGGKSTPVADASKYKPKQFYVERLAATREKIIARLRAMKPEDFQQPTPDPAMRERFPTIGHVAMVLGTWHEAYHAGQLSTWRRVQGLPAV